MTTSTTLCIVAACAIVAAVAFSRLVRPLALVERFEGALVALAAILVGLAFTRRKPKTKRDDDLERDATNSSSRRSGWSIEIEEPERHEDQTADTITDRAGVADSPVVRDSGDDLADFRARAREDGVVE